MPADTAQRRTSESTAAPPAPARRPRGGGRGRLIAPKQPIPRGLAVALTGAGFAIVFGVWALLSYGGIVEDFFLPTPTESLSKLYDLFASEGFLTDVWTSTYRILMAFALAAVIAIPLGIAIGSYRVAQAFFEPVIAAVRYMPATAFIPLLIIWFGIGDGEKVAVIFIGVFFPLTLLMADVSANVPKSFLDIASTLGASRAQVFRRVLLPACYPGIVDNLRIGIGWAWTYLIVAELVAAESGIGHEILNAGRFLDTETVIAGILTIGALGLATDALFRFAHRRLFPYQQQERGR
jgi:NitT/TauT family transport system permease protein